jgi:hypothetical protein
MARNENKILVTMRISKDLRTPARFRVADGGSRKRVCYSTTGNHTALA